MCIKEIFGCITVELELPEHLYGIEKKHVFLRKGCLSKVSVFWFNHPNPPRSKRKNIHQISRIGWFINPVSSRTKKLMADTNFSDYKKSIIKNKNRIKHFNHLRLANRPQTISPIIRQFCACHHFISLRGQ